MSSVDYYDVERMIRDASYRYADRDDFHAARQSISDHEQRIYTLENEIAALRSELRSAWDEISRLGSRP